MQYPARTFRASAERPLFSTRYNRDLRASVTDANIVDITLMSTYERFAMNYEVGLMSVYDAQWGRGVQCHMVVFYADGDLAVHLGDRVREWSVMEEDLQHIRQLGGDVATLVDNEVGVIKMTTIGDVETERGLSCLCLAMLEQASMGDDHEEN